MTKVWFNHKYLSCEQVPPMADTSFLSGNGIFETLKGRNFQPVAFELHWSRLLHGAGRFGIDAPDKEDVHDGFCELMKMNQLPDARLRLTLTKNSLLLTASPPPPPIENAAVLTVPFRRNEHSPLTGIKSISYAENILILQQAKERGFDEAVLANSVGNLCEGTFTNIFVRFAGQWITPPISAGPLPGVTRQLVLTAAQQIGFPINQADSKLSDLAEAEAVFLTSSLRGILPVRRVNQTDLPDFDTGEIKMLSDAYREISLA